MSAKRTTLVAGFTVFLLAGTAACGSTGEATSQRSSEKQTAEQRSSTKEGQQRSAVDSTVVHRNAEHDYDMLSLTELGEREPVVLLGEVVGWTNGRTGVEKGNGYKYTDLYGVLEIEITESYRTPESHGDSNRVFVEVPRGGEERDGNEPDNTEPVLSTVDELDEAVPPGTRVIFAGGKAPTKTEWEKQAPGTKVRDTTVDSVSAKDLLWPHMQGLVFEDENGDFVSGMTDDEDQWDWVPDAKSPGDGFDYLVDELDDLEQ